VVRDIPENGVALAEEMKRRNLDFTNLAAVEQTVVDLISVGKPYLNPAAISAEFEQRHGDELDVPRQCRRSHRVHQPLRSNKQDGSKLSADQFGTRILSFPRNFQRPRATNHSRNQKLSSTLEQRE
jgi:hypothetical protein